MKAGRVSAGALDTNQNGDAAVAHPAAGAGAALVPSLSLGSPILPRGRACRLFLRCRAPRRAFGLGAFIRLRRRAWQHTAKDGANRFPTVRFGRLARHAHKHEVSRVREVVPGVQAHGN